MQTRPEELMGASKGITPVPSVDPGRSELHQITAITTAISMAFCSDAFCSSFLWLKLPFDRLPAAATAPAVVAVVVTVSTNRNLVHGRFARSACGQ